MDPHDFQLYYSGTYIKDKDGHILYVLGYDGANSVRYYVVTAPEKADNSWIGEEKRLPFENFLGLMDKRAFPVFGYKKYFDHSVCFTQLQPKREQKRAFNTTKTTFIYPNSQELMEIFGIHYLELNAGGNLAMLASQMFDSYSFGIRQTYEDIMAGRTLGGVLSPTLALVAKANIKKPVLFYKTKRIGVVSEGSRALTIKLFKVFQEYNSLIQRDIIDFQNIEDITVEEGI